MFLDHMFSTYYRNLQKYCRSTACYIRKMKRKLLQLSVSPSGVYVTYTFCSNGIEFLDLISGSLTYLHSHQIPFIFTKRRKEK